MKLTAVLALFFVAATALAEALPQPKNGQCINLNPSSAKDQVLMGGTYRVTEVPNLTVDHEKAFHVQLYVEKKGFQRSQVATVTDLSGFEVTTCPKDAATAAAMAVQLESELARLNATISTAFPSSCPAGYTPIPRDPKKAGYIPDIPPIIQTLECEGGSESFFTFLTLTSEGTSRVNRVLGMYRAPRDCHEKALGLPPDISGGKATTAKLGETSADETETIFACTYELTKGEDPRILNHIRFSQGSGVDGYSEFIRGAYIHFLNLAYEMKRGVKWKGEHTARDLAVAVRAQLDDHDVQEKMAKASPETKLLLDGIRKNLADEKVISKAISSLK